MRSGRKLALAAGVAALATTAVAQPAQKVTGPIATYWVSAATQTGFGMSPGGGAPNIAAMMGGGGGASKTLNLQLGSSQSNPAPAADHLPPAALQAGPALPLLTPKVTPPPPREDVPDIPREFQKPRGKMLIFWGCGERAKPGQPVVIDFAQMAQNPQAMANVMRGINVTPMRPPAPGRNTTYGDWPNERARTNVQPTSSLVGEHTVRGNYSPEIKFTLEADQDFLGALNLTTNAKAPAGHVNVGWNLVPNAVAYFAQAMGGGQNDTFVIWTSSEVQAASFAMPDYISPGDINRLVTQKVLMSPATRACAVPKEAVDAMGQAGILSMTAYGGEANFVYPPRPQDPKVTWNQQWNVKVRYRSATGGLLGMTMPGMGGAGFPGMPGGRAPASGQPAPGQPPQQPPPRGVPGFPGLPGGLPIPIPGRGRFPF